MIIKWQQLDSSPMVPIHTFVYIENSVNSSFPLSRFPVPYFKGGLDINNYTFRCAGPALPFVDHPIISHS